MSQDASPTRPHNALDGGHTQTTEWESRDWGCSRVRGEDRQKELDRVRVHSKSRSAVRVGSAARVVGGARVGNCPRAVGTIRPRHAAGTRCRNLESGHPNVGGRNPAVPLATP